MARTRNTSRKAGKKPNVPVSSDAEDIVDLTIDSNDEAATQNLSGERPSQNNNDESMSQSLLSGQKSCTQKPKALQRSTKTYQKKISKRTIKKAVSDIVEKKVEAKDANLLSPPAIPLKDYSPDRSDSFGRQGHLLSFELSHSQIEDANPSNSIHSSQNSPPKDLSDKSAPAAVAPPCTQDMPQSSQISNSNRPKKLRLSKSLYTKYLDSEDFEIPPPLSPISTLQIPPPVSPISTSSPRIRLPPKKDPTCTSSRTDNASKLKSSVDIENEDLLLEWLKGKPDLLSGFGKRQGVKRNEAFLEKDEELGLISGTVQKWYKNKRNQYRRIAKDLAKKNRSGSAFHSANEFQKQILRRYDVFRNFLRKLEGGKTPAQLDLSESYDSQSEVHVDVSFKQSEFIDDDGTYKPINSLPNSGSSTILPSLSKTSKKSDSAISSSNLHAAASGSSRSIPRSEPKTMGKPSAQPSQKGSSSKSSSRSSQRSASRHIPDGNPSCTVSRETPPADMQSQSQGSSRREILQQGMNELLLRQENLKSTLNQKPIDAARRSFGECIGHMTAPLSEANFMAFSVATLNLISTFLDKEKTDKDVFSKLPQPKNAYPVDIREVDESDE